MRVRASSCVLLILVSLVAVAQTAPELVAEGERHLLRGEFLLAIDVFREALEVNPNDLGANLGLADAYFIIDEIDQAQQQIEIALRLARTDNRVRVLAGRIAVAAGDVSVADAIFAEVLAAEPNNLDASIARAELALAQGRSSAARATLEQSLRVRPNHRRALLSLALVYEYQGEIAIASDYIELAQRVHRDRADVHLVAAQFYSRIGDIDRAGAAARTARALDAEALPAARILAGIALEDGNALQAISLAEQLIVADRSDHNAWFLRASGLRAASNDADAMTSIRTAMSIAPDEELYRVWAEELAIASLELTDPIRQELAIHRTGEAEALSRAYQYAAAERRFQRALVLAPLESTIRESYAEHFLAQGFSATYLQELSVARDGILPEEIDVLRRAISGDLAARWGVNQFTVEREQPSIALYAARIQAFPWSDTVPAVLDYVASTMRSTDVINVAEAALVDDAAQAFARARTQDVDFFAILSLGADENTLSLALELFVARTGVSTERITSVRSGPGYVSSAVEALVIDATARLPETARVVARRGNLVLIDRGARDGSLAAEWIVVAKDAPVTAPDQSDYIYAETDVRAAAIVGESDDLISEATITIQGRVDRVQSGDVLLTVPLEEPEQEESTDDPPERSDLGLLLYQRIRRLR